MNQFLDRASTAALLRPWLVYFGAQEHVTEDTPVTEPKIKVVKDPAVSGYAHAFVLMKPWTVYIDRKQLVDKSGRPRRFSTEAAAMAAARRSIA